MDLDPASDIVCHACTIHNGIGLYLIELEHLSDSSSRAWAAKKYVDPKRIGIWGWVSRYRLLFTHTDDGDQSYGGFMSSKIAEANAGIHSLAMAVAVSADPPLTPIFSSTMKCRHRTRHSQGADSLVWCHPDWDRFHKGPCSKRIGFSNWGLGFFTYSGGFLLVIRKRSNGPSACSALGLQPYEGPGSRPPVS